MTEEMNKLKEILDEVMGEELYQLILSNPRNREAVEKIRIRPVLLKNQLFYQETMHIGTQVFHNNYQKAECVERICHCLNYDFRQAEISTRSLRVTVLVSRKGKISIRKKVVQAEKTAVDLSHNRTKSYLLQEGTVVPFLVDLGVQTPEGKIIRSRYDKFKQINRFLEFIEDLLPTLKKKDRVHIIDFGCGKSYLTFAVYYYLKILHGMDLRITGLDLKKDVVRNCNALAEKYGYEELHFEIGDISNYQEETHSIDMVMTLHACDTATDYALMKAVEWRAEVILSVPCCQHEVNRSIGNDILHPLFQYGLLKERTAALCTDAIRAGILESCGYDVQILEFIDMTHTPKNILIRACRSGKKARHDGSAVEEMCRFLQVDPVLLKWYRENRAIQSNTKESCKVL